MNISTNLFDCAAKQVERDHIAAELEKFISKGGHVQTVESVYKPQIFKEFNSGNKEKQVFSEKTARILDSIRNGNFNTQRVVLSTNIKNFEVHATINYLIKLGHVKKIVSGRSHKLEVVEDEGCEA